MYRTYFYKSVLEGDYIRQNKIFIMRPYERIKYSYDIYTYKQLLDMLHHDNVTVNIYKTHFITVATPLSYLHTDKKLWVYPHQFRVAHSIKVHTNV